MPWTSNVHVTRVSRGRLALYKSAGEPMARNAVAKVNVSTDTASASSVTKEQTAAAVSVPRGANVMGCAYSAVSVRATRASRALHAIKAIARITATETAFAVAILASVNAWLLSQALPVLIVCAPETALGMVPAWGKQNHAIVTRNGVAKRANYPSVRKRTVLLIVSNMACAVTESANAIRITVVNSARISNARTTVLAMANANMVTACVISTMIRKWIVL